MEADEKNIEAEASVDADHVLPFNTCPRNFQLYKELVANNEDKILEIQVVERLQNFGLLPSSMLCPTNKSDCKVTCRVAIGDDRVQWFCEGCGKSQPIRAGSFFLRLQCSIVQALQTILAWCEDADIDVAAEYFGVNPEALNQIYNKLDDVAIKEYNKHQLGGENSVVLAELYPDCMNRLSPDTTHQPHGHRILMLTDTNHIPAYYRLHFIKEDTKKTKNVAAGGNEMMKSQIEEIISKSVKPGSMLVTGHSLPPIEGPYSIKQVTHCDKNMQHFLNKRIWLPATKLCAASRELCACGDLPELCEPAVQRYLHASLYRWRFGDGFYKQTLERLAAEYTTSGPCAPAVDL